MSSRSAQLASAFYLSATSLFSHLVIFPFRQYQWLKPIDSIIALLQVCSQKNYHPGGGTNLSSAKAILISWISTGCSTFPTDFSSWLFSPKSFFQLKGSSGMTYISFKCVLNIRTTLPQLELNSPTKVLLFVRIIRSAMAWMFRSYRSTQSTFPTPPSLKWSDSFSSWGLKTNLTRSHPPTIVVPP
mmetsp:Transcript_886/g.1642  ORF Transcript_886/g.1642 Transcript_886/m.1642 type:complete len:186 (-) Transcript_886:507-1064(-)